MHDLAALVGSGLGEHPLLPAFLFLLLFGFTLPIPEEAALVLVGVALRAAGRPFPEAYACALLALCLADLVYYSAARGIGPRLLRVRFVGRLLRPERIEEAERYFRLRGAGIVFACRFVVGLRTAAILSSGLLRLPLRRFLAYDAGALALGSAAWLGAGFFLGARMSAGLGGLERLLSIAAPLAVALAAFFLYRRIAADRARLLGGQRPQAAARPSCFHRHAEQT